MARPIACPNCGTLVKSVSVAESAYDAYLCMVVKGVSNKAYCASRGLTPPTATLYRRLGIAIVDIGIDPDSLTFKHLRQSANANMREIAHVIETPGATPASVTEILRRYIDEDGKRIR